MRDVTGEDAPDKLIAFVADADGLVIVTHDRDSRRFSKLVSGEQRHQFATGAGTILLRVREGRAATRLQGIWHHVLYHFDDAAARSERFHLVVNEASIQVVDKVRPS